MTLTGPGGTGKTRLALEIGAEALDRYPDGVFFVDLSPLTDPALVVPTIAATLGVREVGRPAPPRRRSSGFLATKRLLLLLDNCEQVLAAAPDVAALLAASPDLTILATSREPLHVRGEREFPLLPLPLPAADRLPPLEELAQVPAVALFVERASATPAGLRADRGERRRGGRHLPAASTACPWPSSWPRRGSRSCRRPRSWPGSSSGCPC